MKFRSLFLVLTLASLLVFPSNVKAQVKAWVEPPGVMIMPDRPAGEGNQIQQTVVRNQFASAQIGLRSETPVEKPLRFEWSDITGPDGKKIARDQIMIYRAASIHVDHGGGKLNPADPARARPLGDFPDALVPIVLADGTPVVKIEPEAEKTASYWVDIFIPSTASPGDYTGAITLKSGDDTLATIPVKLNVLNIEIPAQTTIPSIFNLRPFTHVKANLDAYIAELMRHRIQPTNGHYLDYMNKPDAGFEMLDKFNPDGKGFISIYVGEEGKMRPSDEKELTDDMRKVTAHLKERKMFDRAFLYLKDEPDAKEIPYIVDAANLILKETPEWKGKLLDTLNSENNALDPMLDYTVRCLKMYGGAYMQSKPPPGGMEEWDARRAQGKHLWFYVSNAQGVPFPTFDVNSPNLAFEPRVLGWAYWYEKAEGHLYWDLMAKEQWSLDKTFPPGDGQLIYPGNLDLPGAPSFALVKDIKEPVISRRLKEQRQGLEEWELLKMAEAKVGREKVAAIVSKVYTCMGQRSWSPNAYNPTKPMWSYDEKAWDEARQEVLDLLK